MNDEDIKAILLDILRMGLLRIRALGNAGDAEACSVEADHLHNLPALIQSFRFELLQFYFDVERPGFVRRSPCGLDQFTPLWERLGKVLQAKSSNSGEHKSG